MLSYSKCRCYRRRAGNRWIMLKYYRTQTARIIQGALVQSSSAFISLFLAIVLSIDVETAIYYQYYLSGFIFSLCWCVISLGVWCLVAKLPMTVMIAEFVSAAASIAAVIGIAQFGEVWQDAKSITIIGYLLAAAETSLRLRQNCQPTSPQKNQHTNSKLSRRRFPMSGASVSSNHPGLMAAANKLVSHLLRGLALAFILIECVIRPRLINSSFPEYLVGPFISLLWWLSVIWGIHLFLHRDFWARIVLPVAALADAVERVGSIGRGYNGAFRAMQFLSSGSRLDQASYTRLYNFNSTQTRTYCGRFYDTIMDCCQRRRIKRNTIVPLGSMSRSRSEWLPREVEWDRAEDMVHSGGFGTRRRCAMTGKDKGKGLMVQLELSQEPERLRRSIYRLWRLVQLGFGEAGQRVIERFISPEGELRDIARGTKVDAIFAFCDVRNFTDISESLQEEIPGLVNEIARIVHYEVAACGGAPNKNMGDAFLCTWVFQSRPLENTATNHARRNVLELAKADAMAGVNYAMSGPELKQLKKDDQDPAENSTGSKGNFLNLFRNLGGNLSRSFVSHSREDTATRADIEPRSQRTKSGGDALRRTPSGPLSAPATSPTATTPVPERTMASAPDSAKHPSNPTCSPVAVPGSAHHSASTADPATASNHSANGSSGPSPTQPLPAQHPPGSSSGGGAHTGVAAGGRLAAVSDTSSRPGTGHFRLSESDNSLTVNTLAHPFLGSDSSASVSGATVSGNSISSTMEPDRRSRGDDFHPLDTARPGYRNRPTLGQLSSNDYTSTPEYSNNSPIANDSICTSPAKAVENDSSAPPSSLDSGTPRSSNAFRTARRQESGWSDTSAPSPSSLTGVNDSALGGAQFLRLDSLHPSDDDVQEEGERRVQGAGETTRAREKQQFVQTELGKPQLENPSSAAHEDPQGRKTEGSSPSSTAADAALLEELLLGASSPSARHSGVQYVGETYMDRSDSLPEDRRPRKGSLSEYVHNNASTIGFITAAKPIVAGNDTGCVESVDPNVEKDIMEMLEEYEAQSNPSSAAPTTATVYKNFPYSSCSSLAAPPLQLPQSLGQFTGASADSSATVSSADTSDRSLSLVKINSSPSIHTGASPNALPDDHQVTVVSVHTESSKNRDDSNSSGNTAAATNSSYPSPFTIIASTSSSNALLQRSPMIDFDLRNMPSTHSSLSLQHTRSSYTRGEDASGSDYPSFHLSRTDGSYRDPYMHKNRRMSLGGTSIIEVDEEEDDEISDTESPWTDSGNSSGREKKSGNRQSRRLPRRGTSDPERTSGGGGSNNNRPRSRSESPLEGASDSSGPNSGPSSGPSSSGGGNSTNKTSPVLSSSNPNVPKSGLSIIVRRRSMLDPHQDSISNAYTASPMDSMPYTPGSVYTYHSTTPVATKDPSISTQTPPVFSTLTRKIGSFDQLQQASLEDPHGHSQSQFNLNMNNNPGNHHQSGSSLRQPGLQGHPSQSTANTPLTATTPHVMDFYDRSKQRNSMPAALGSEYHDRYNTRSSSVSGTSGPVKRHIPYRHSSNLSGTMSSYIRRPSVSSITSSAPQRSTAMMIGVDWQLPGTPTITQPHVTMSDLLNPQNSTVLSSMHNTSHSAAPIDPPGFRDSYPSLPSDAQDARRYAGVTTVATDASAVSGAGGNRPDAYPLYTDVVTHGGDVHPMYTNVSNTQLSAVNATDMYDPRNHDQRYISDDTVSRHTMGQHPGHVMGLSGPYSSQLNLLNNTIAQSQRVTSTYRMQMHSFLPTARRSLTTSTTLPSIGGPTAQNSGDGTPGQGQGQAHLQTQGQTQGQMQRQSQHIQYGQQTGHHDSPGYFVQGPQMYFPDPMTQVLSKKPGNRSNAFAASNYRQLKGVTVMANNALCSYINVMIKLHASNEVGGSLHSYRKHPAVLNSSLCADGTDFRIRMGMGLHIGWSIETPIGSMVKLDCSYLSPAVNACARLESATRFYGCDLLVSRSFAQCLSLEVVSLLRRVDRVQLKGLSEPIELYTFDWDAYAAMCLLRTGGYAGAASAVEEARYFNYGYLQDVYDATGPRRNIDNRNQRPHLVVQIHDGIEDSLYLPPLGSPENLAPPPIIVVKDNTAASPNPPNSVGLTRDPASHDTTAHSEPRPRIVSPSQSESFPIHTSHHTGSTGHSASSAQASSSGNQHSSLQTSSNGNGSFGKNSGNGASFYSIRPHNNNAGALSTLSPSSGLGSAQHVLSPLSHSYTPHSASNTPSNSTAMHPRQGGGTSGLYSSVSLSDQQHQGSFSASGPHDSSQFSMVRPSLSLAPPGHSASAYGSFPVPTIPAHGNHPPPPLHTRTPVSPVSPMAGSNTHAPFAFQSRRSFSPSRRELSQSRRALSPRYSTADSLGELSGVFTSPENTLDDAVGNKIGLHELNSSPSRTRSEADNRLFLGMRPNFFSNSLRKLSSHFSFGNDGIGQSRANILRANSVSKRKKAAPKASGIRYVRPLAAGTREANKIIGATPGQRQSYMDGHDVSTSHANDGSSSSAGGNERSNTSTGLGFLPRSLTRALLSVRNQRKSIAEDNYSYKTSPNDARREDWDGSLPTSAALDDMASDRRGTHFLTGPAATYPFVSSDEQVADLVKLQPESAFPQEFVDCCEISMETYLGDYDPEENILYNCNWSMARHYALKGLEICPNDGPLRALLEIIDTNGVKDENGIRAPDWWKGYRVLDEK